MHSCLYVFVSKINKLNNKNSAVLNTLYFQYHASEYENSKTALLKLNDRLVWFCMAQFRACIYGPHLIKLHCSLLMKFARTTYEAPIWYTFTSQTLRSTYRNTASVFKSSHERPMRLPYDAPLHLSHSGPLTEILQVCLKVWSETLHESHFLVTNQQRERRCFMF